MSAAAASFYRPPQGSRQHVHEPRCGEGGDDVVWRTRWDEAGTEGCGRMLARFITKPARIDCPRCKRPNSWGEVPSLPAEP